MVKIDPAVTRSLPRVNFSLSVKDGTARSSSTICDVASGAKECSSRARISAFTLRPLSIAAWPSLAFSSGGNLRLWRGSSRCGMMILWRKVPYAEMVQRGWICATDVPRYPNVMRLGIDSGVRKMFLFCSQPKVSGGKKLSRIPAVSPEHIPAGRDRTAWHTASGLGGCSHEGF